MAIGNPFDELFAPALGGGDPALPGMQPPYTLEPTAGDEVLTAPQASAPPGGFPQGRPIVGPDPNESDIFAFGRTEAAPGAVPPPQFSPGDQSLAYRRAMQRIESSGNYGQVTRTGNPRQGDALGAYQV